MSTIFILYDIVQVYTVSPAVSSKYKFELIGSEPAHWYPFFSRVIGNVCQVSSVLEVDIVRVHPYIFATFSNAFSLSIFCQRFTHVESILIWSFAGSVVAHNPPIH